MHSNHSAPEPESRSVADLITAVLRGGARRSSAAFGELTSYAREEVFEEACRLCGSKGKRRRELGADILGRLDPDRRVFAARSLPVLLDMLARETDVDVLASVATALGKACAPAGRAALLKLKTHPSRFVRFAVVMGLLRDEDPLAVRILIELTTDEGVGVRDWATFGIGSQIDADTESIREALVQRLSDENEMVRAEALVGLAKRHDERAPELVLGELERLVAAQEFSPLAVESAELIRDRRFLPFLRSLQVAWLDDVYFSHLLDDAILACEGQNK